MGFSLHLSETSFEKRCGLFSETPINFLLAHISHAPFEKVCVSVFQDLRNSRMDKFATSPKRIYWMCERNKTYGFSGVSTQNTG